jgi:hypothetical protein
MEALDCQDVKNVLEQCNRSYDDLKARTDQKDTMNKVLSQLKQKLEHMELIYPLIVVMTSKDLKETHWAKIK